MSKPIPTIQKFMTTNPHTIGKDQTLAACERAMRDLNVRHLPVLDGGTLLGVITDRDLKFMETFKDVDPRKTKVSDVFISDFFKVSPNAKLDEVCSEMAEKKIGSCLVVDNDRLVGIFTWIDALRAMSELLHTRLHI